MLELLIYLGRPMEIDLKNKSPLFQRAIVLIQKIPKGKVVSYGQVSEFISAPGCARHISYILSSSAKKYQLPWHRVISSSGKLPKHSKQYLQKELLENEGVNCLNNKIDLNQYAWKPSKRQIHFLLKNLPQHRSIFSS